MLYVLSRLQIIDSSLQIFVFNLMDVCGGQKERRELLGIGVRGEDGGSGIVNRVIWKQRGEKKLNK